MSSVVTGQTPYEFVSHRLVTETHLTQLLTRGVTLDQVAQITPTPTAPTAIAAMAKTYPGTLLGDDRLIQVAWYRR